MMALVGAYIEATARDVEPPLLLSLADRQVAEVGMIRHGYSLSTG